MATRAIGQDFEWDVAADGYRWIDSKRGLALVRVGDANDSTEPNTAVRRYQPFTKTHSGLFLTFAQLDRTPEAVLSFANQYGLLGFPVSWNFWGGDPVSIAAPDGVYHPTGATFDHMAQAGGVVGELFNGASHPGSPWSWSEQIQMLAGFLQRRDALRADPQHLAPTLQAEVNLALAETAAPYVEWSARAGTFHLRLRPRSLIGALWLQAAHALAEPTTFTECPVCGRPIELSRSGGARSDAMFCSNACKSRDYRHRQSEARRLARMKGWTRARIAKRLRTDVRTVRGWLT